MIVKTSLQRFLDTRGAELLGNSVSRRVSRLQWGVGGLLISLGVAILPTTISGRQPVEWLADAGLLAGGLAVMALTYRYSRHALDQPEAPTLTLTPEARKLLESLCRTRPAGRFSRMPMTGTAVETPKPRRRVPRSLPMDVLDLLEEATAEYHAIQGTLRIEQGSSQALIRSSQRISRAAEETLGQILHNAAILVQYPESSLTTRDVMSLQLGSLYELARHVDVIASAEPSLADRLTSQSLMDVVLEEMRMDERTRSELNR